MDQISNDLKIINMLPEETLNIIFRFSGTYNKILLVNPLFRYIFPNSVTIQTFCDFIKTRIIIFIIERMIIMHV